MFRQFSTTHWKELQDGCRVVVIGGKKTQYNIRPSTEFSQLNLDESYRDERWHYIYTDGLRGASFDTQGRLLLPF